MDYNPTDNEYYMSQTSDNEAMDSTRVIGTAVIMGLWGMMFLLFGLFSLLAFCYSIGRTWMMIPIIMIVLFKNAHRISDALDITGRYEDPNRDHIMRRLKGG